MKKILMFFYAICVASTAVLNAAEISRPSVKGSSAFIIFTDSQTYKECSDELIAYKNVLEEEMLSAYLVHDNWKDPEAVKEQIKRITKTSKVPVEGMVFIGNIPIVRVRGGQHMTTAFKMNEETFPIDESSVTSDRFYDCPNLSFEFLCRDSTNSKFFYYKLTDKGSQRVAPMYYSARILVPKQFVKDTGKSEYELMRSYLTKVVKAHKEQNCLDNYTYFAGNGYNSDCLTQWRQQQLVFSSYFNNANGTFLNFRMDPVMKKRLYTYMQNPDTDLFLFYEHGSPDKQHINEGSSAFGLDDSMEALFYEIRSFLRRHKNPEKQEAVRKDICSHFELDEIHFVPDSLEAWRAADKIRSTNKDILLSDLVKLKTGSRMTIFNACYNGSFHRDGYVAGYHLFNDGTTIVTQGNTVNVLQDKWGEQLVGMLALGARVGFWQKEVATLESHLCGDPTFAFAPSGSASLSGKELNRILAVGATDTYWEKLLCDKCSNVRTLAIKKLSNSAMAGADRGKKIALAEKLYKIYRQDGNMTVRTQALYDLSFLDSPLFAGTLKKSLHDYSELISRFSAHWAGKVGDTTLVPVLKDLQENYPQLQRVNYAASSALGAYSAKRLDPADESLVDKLRRLRNLQSYCDFPQLISFIKNDSLKESTKLVVCEALGWMLYHKEKTQLIKELNQLVNDESLSAAVRSELRKTVKRLQWQ